MGIFTSTGFSGTSVDIYSPAEQELCCEGFDINFYEASMVAVAESEAIYNRSMKEVGIAELRYFEENGQEVIYEAVDVKAIFNKIKMFFKKLIDKVKAIFHTFISKLSSMVQSDKEFVKKYEKEFARKWNDVREDFEFKGYKFTINDNISEVSKDAEGVVSDEIDDYLNKRSTATEENLTDINALLTKVKDTREELIDKIRAETFNDAAEMFSTMSISDKTSMDSKEFSEELFMLFRNGESSKENIEKKDIAGGVATITSELRSAEKTKKAAEKAVKNANYNINLCIKKLDRWEKDLLKELPNKDKKDIITNYTSACISMCSEESSGMKSRQEFNTQAVGAFLQALKDRSKQYKAIMVKVISGSKKMQRESYEYTNESYEYGSGSFLDSVVLK